MKLCLKIQLVKKRIFINSDNFSFRKVYEFAGPEGNGKSFAAKVLANKIKAPFISIFVNDLVSKNLNELALICRNIEKVFLMENKINSLRE